MKSTHKLLLFVLLVVGIYYVNKCNNKETWANTQPDTPPDTPPDTLDNNNDGILKLDEQKCSVSCCKFNQWPLPIELRAPKSDYIGSNFSCNNGGPGTTAGGCVCFEPKHNEVLSNHAGNLINNSCNK